MIEPLTSPATDRRHDLLVAACLGFLALSVYLLTFSGLFRSIDELTMFAQVESLAQGMGPNAPQLQYAEIHHHFRARFEATQAFILLPLYLVGTGLSQVGNEHTVLLFAPLISSAAVALIWLTLRELGFSVRTGVLATLGMGFATLIWPYSRTLYREPVTTFSLALAFYFFVRYQKARSLRDGFMSLLPLLVSVAARSETIISLGIFSLALVLVDRRNIFRLAPLISLAWFLGGLILASNFGYRFSPQSLGGEPLQMVISRFKLDQMPSRIWGLTIAPGKGLFIYSPLLALFPIGVKLLWERHRILVGLLLTLALFYLLLFSMYFDWRGGVAWGPRFLVPVAVPLIILVAPIFSRSGWLCYLGVVGILVSMVIQFVAATANWTVYYNHLRQQFPGGLTPVFLDPGAYGWSPVIGQFQIWRPENMDLIWLRAPQAGELPILAPQVLATLLFLLLVAAASLYLILVRGMASPARILLLEGGIFLAGIFIFLRQASGLDAGYWDADPPALRSVAEEINASPTRNPLIVSVSSNFGYNTLMNYLKGDLRHFWLSPLQEELGFLSSATSQAGHIFLVTDSLVPGSENSYAEQWLNAQAFRYDAQWFGPYALFRYGPSQTLSDRESGSQEWPGIRLVEFSLTTEELQPGDLLPLEFTFTATAPIPKDYSFFVHLIQSDGAVIDGEDAPPQYGARPTSSWQVGELVTDRRALVIPQTMAAGEYGIEIGITLNGERVKPLAGEGLTERDTFIIAEVITASQ